MAIGNINAIGDWFKNRSYGKPAIDDFFLKMNEGLTAYLFKIKAYADDEIVISGQTSLKEYKFKMPSNRYEVLLFFTSGETVDAVDGDDSLEIELTTREIYITFGYEEVVLWDYVADNSGNVPNADAYTLNLHDDVSNYGKLYVKLHAYLGNMNEPDNIFTVPISVLPDAKVTNRMCVATGNGIWRDRYAIFEFSGTTLKKITGGSYSAQSMGVLTVIGAIMHYTKTLLWDYVTDNDNVIPYAKGSVTLRDAIENYDELIIEVMSANTDTNSCFYNLNVNALVNGRQPNRVLWTSYSDRTVSWYISGTTFEKTSGSSSTTTNGLVRVYGIKY